MYESIKKFAEVTGLLAAALIFLGLCRMHAFYSHYHINIVSYLDFTEILLSIFSDLTALLIVFILLIVLGSVGLVLFAGANWLIDRITLRNSPVKRNAFESMNAFFHAEASRTLRLFIAAIGVVALAGMLLYVKYSADSRLINTSLYWTSGEAAGNKFFLLMMACSLLILSLTGKFKTLFISVGMFALVGIFFFLGNLHVDSVSTWAKSERWTFSYNADTVNIRTTDQYYLIGKTNNYYFLYDEPHRRTDVLKVADMHAVSVNDIAR